MHTTRVKEKIVKVNGHVDLMKIARGHVPHRGGSGQHHDRRTNRQRTRSAQRRAALAEQ